jgi:amino acid transporter
VGLSEYLASNGQFPPVLGRSVGRWHASVGLVVMAVFTLLLVVAFDLSAIASLGSAVALIVFSLVTLAHFRVREQTGARVVVLLVALVSTLGTLAVFASTTLVDQPATAVALLVIVLGAVVVDQLWSRTRDRRAAAGT